MSNDVGGMSHGGPAKADSGSRVPTDVTGKESTLYDLVRPCVHVVHLGHLLLHLHRTKRHAAKACDLQAMKSVFRVVRESRDGAAQA